MPAHHPGPCVQGDAERAEILNLLAQGPSNAEIALAGKITIGTVKHHLGEAAFKLDLHSRILLARNWSYPLFRLGAGRDDRSGCD